MDNERRKGEITINGWRIDATGEWSARPPEAFADAAKHVVRAIEGIEGCLYYRSRYAVTYQTQITGESGNVLEVYIKAFEPPHGLAAVKGMMRGGRARNFRRVTEELHREGFRTPPLLLSGVHDASARTMLTSARADGISLPELAASTHDHGFAARKRALMRALGTEIARLHRAGVVHGDLTPYNIFVVQSEPPRFIFLDHDRTRRAFPAWRHYRQLRNLVQLGRFDLPGLSNTDRLRFFDAYAAGLGRARRRAMARRVARMLARRRRRDAN
ncbi:MAG TPA: lipopolysaccharide kinase InaA family protein [Candidatus Binataceae bacterium]|nr:lipopolysaccharide kinase InaA family protein [Candidatus Binataceae bacterium]